MQYTKDQQAALDNMLKWLTLEPENELDLLYTLNGAAGTGKTTIIREFLKLCGIKKNKIAVTAPTHKAKKVIAEATGFMGHTIQKLLGLRPDLDLKDFDVNNPIFVPIGEETIQYYKYVLIDEASMLNEELFNYLADKADVYDIRIIFLGDELQLPPINERIGKVFSHVKHKSTLREVVRQGKDNPMTTILELLRQDVENGTQNGIQAMTTNKSIVIADKGFRCLSSRPSEQFGQETFGQVMLDMFRSSEYQVNKDYIKFLAYTNDTVEFWSKLLRERLLGELANNIINEGEILTGYKLISDKKHNTIIIETSRDYIVKKCMYTTSEASIKGYSVTLELDTGGTRNVFIVDHTDEENLNLFRVKLADVLDTAKARRGYYWKKYYTFKEAHLTLVQVLRNPNQKPSKYNTLCKKDLYYGYGSTVHKSQGSTYDNVALNLKDLYSNYDISERSRLIYVALSRSKNMNLILVQ